MKKPVTGSFELIKNLNTACILNMIRTKGSISRADIARCSGLTPATVSNITSELIDLKLIIETERGESSGGRKPILLSINNCACYFGAIHIGTFNVDVAICDVSADILLSESFSLDSKRNKTPESAIDTALKVLETLKNKLKTSKLFGIGVCTHGLVKSEQGLLVFAPNLGWSDVPLKKMIEEKSGLPVFVENDVRGMALAESWCGLACGVKDYVYLYIGPGIGGSIISGNELYCGNVGFAGEFGHSTVVPDGPMCSCGNRGCLQAVASETAVLKNYVDRKRKIDKDFSCNSYNDIIEAVKNGDQIARDEILKSIRYIAIEVGNIINTLSPHLIVINGNITKLDDLMLNELKTETKLHSMCYSDKENKIVISTVNKKASIKGAATCIIRQMFESPRKFLSE